MRVLSSQGDLVDSCDPAGAEGAPHRVLPGLRRALLHVQGREAGAGAGGGRAAGAVLVRGPAGGAAPAHGRRREPKVAISSPAQSAG